MNLSNIIFCKPGTEIYEVGPKFNEIADKVFKDRYKTLAEMNNLKFFRLVTDSVEVKDHPILSKKFINKSD